jgi:peptidoglycan/LPS O-acetylase OafA/YrhL
MSTTLPLRDYLTNAQTWDYALSNLHFGPRLVWLLPGVFAEHPVALVNGSIWTLPVEVLMYACVGVLGILGILARRLWLIALLAALFIFVIVGVVPSAKTIYLDYLRMAGLFALGAACCVWREHIPVHGAVVLALAALAWLLHTTAAYAYLFALSEVAFVFWFAYGLGGAQSRLRAFNRCGDYSYGLYLWGYPAQQIVVAITGPQDALLNAASGFALALLFAIASWHAIEQPALRLKAASFPIRGSAIAPD